MLSRTRSEYIPHMMLDGRLRPTVLESMIVAPTCSNIRKTDLGNV